MAPAAYDERARSEVIGLLAMLAAETSRRAQCAPVAS